jgi:hypothetical protein
MPKDICQRKRNGLTAAATGVLISLLFSSCNYGPPRVQAPEISPSRAGRQAIEDYDIDGDGVLAGEELSKTPGLKAALARLDTNNDNGLSADEVADRIDAWAKNGIGVMTFGFTVTLNGSPLSDAVATFEPEAFLGDEIKPASCTTNRYGGGSATIAKQDRPDPTWPPGMHLGFYKVKISKIAAGKETIPAKYNDATVLGQEVAPDVSEILNNRVVYALTSK